MLRVNRVLAGLFCAIGVVLLVETAVVSGGVGLQVGYLAGLVFVALGVLRWRAMRPPGR